jgi:hypothetical protein
MGCNNRLRLHNMAQLYCFIVGDTMTWVVEHSDGLTQFALIAIPTILVFVLVIVGATKTPEASDLDGYPIAADYPPLSEENIVELRERKMKSHPSKGQL